MNKKSVKKLTLSRESLRVLERGDLRKAAGGTNTGITLCDVITCVPTPKRIAFDTE